MELVSTSVKTIRSKYLPLEEILILPIGDLQYGSDGCDLSRFKRHIEWGVKQPNAYFLGMGDFLDLASPSNRGRIKAMIAQKQIYDVVEKAIEDQADLFLEEIKSILEPTRGRWLGFHDGHHAWEYANGTTTDTKLAEWLGTPYLGDAAISNIKFKGQRGRGLNIYSHHGEGSGSLQSSPINKLERFANSWEDIDVFLIAHYHRKVAAKLQRICPIFPARGTPYLEHRNIIIACTGGFLKGYSEFSSRGDIPAGGYVEQNMLAPVALGSVIIWARPKPNGEIDLDISI